MYLYGYDLRLPGPLDRLSTRFPEETWSAHPLGPRWIVRGSGPFGSSVAPPHSENPVSATPRGPRSFLYTPKRAEREVLHDAARWGATVVPPMTWSAGRATIRLVTRSATLPRSWRRRHPEARLVVKRRVEPEEVLALLERPTEWPPALTPRQAEAILGAVDAGYYELPRRSHVSEIARRLGIARSTTEEHLRAAESILIRSIVPLVEARRRTAGGSDRIAATPPLDYYARFCAELDLYVQMALDGEEIAGVTLRRERPGPQRLRDHPYLGRILHHISTGRDDLGDLPVSLDVGPFDRRVLEEVRRIPPGETRTYAEIARQIGAPRAARAVGNAVAKNPAIVVVPCHRVVPAAGGVGNYSGTGGPETKRRLLERERARLSSAHARGFGGRSRAERAASGRPTKG